MKLRRPVVQLTALLDLLFIMIFVSLNQTRIPKVEVKPENVDKPVVAEKVEVKKSLPKEFAVAAEFNFSGTPNNQGIPEGSFRMQGSFNRDSGILQLGGTEWINRPANYDMIPLSGVIGDKRQRFKGRIEFQGCEEFILTRTISSGQTEISGTWKGTYSCQQGETGLELIIR